MQTDSSAKSNVVTVCVVQRSDSQTTDVCNIQELIESVWSVDGNESVKKRAVHLRPKSVHICDEL